MKRLQIMIDEHLDEALAVEATRNKTSKAALIREYVAERLDVNARPDPLDEIVGIWDGEVGPETIDDVVYPR
jgi:hypothetical protein